ncbi:MAG TPA: hypothetical protein VFD39_00050 [Trueperaceae bacterium]|nr:hypothetical protein [Trueperaceae bacterium]
METFLIIARNAVIILLSLAVFAGAGVAFATWFADNSHEAH